MLACSSLIRPNAFLKVVLDFLIQMSEICNSFGNVSSYILRHPEFSYFHVSKLSSTEVLFISFNMRLFIQQSVQEYFTFLLMNFFSFLLLFLLLLSNFIFHTEYRERCGSLHTYVNVDISVLGCNAVWNCI